MFSKDFQGMVIEEFKPVDGNYLILIKK